MVYHPHLYPHRMQRTEPIYKTPVRRTEGEGEGEGGSEAKCECEDDAKGDGDDGVMLRVRFTHADTWADGKVKGQHQFEGAGVGAKKGDWG